jgi:HEAT repeat protein
LVRKIDNRAPELLARELASPSPARRLRAVATADLMGIVSKVEQRIVELLHDNDHSVRIEVARALAGSPTNEAVRALMKAMNDPSDLVREAAEESLLQIKQLREQVAETIRGAARKDARDIAAPEAVAGNDPTADTAHVAPVASPIPTIPPPPQVIGGGR